MRTGARRVGLTLVELLVVLVIVSIVALVLWFLFTGLFGKNWAARKIGGTAQLELKENHKLVNCAWKEGSNLWILTRPAQPGESAVTYEFHEISNRGILEGTYIIREKVLCEKEVK